ncbi:DUF177 domain-containing protein [Angustibacter sp. Root456]|uniref:YceD family protein n=1 Tax=Angustibacter sp. Root456 TaxID=1736539 RepID=UPI001F2A3054|nr:YceD family protein [Angustibacter sp. Root456]
MLDTHELGRRPGSMVKISREVPAPAEMGTDVIGVAEGSPLRLDLRLESVMEGVLVTGTVAGRATGECGRCLTDLEQDVEVELMELYAYPGKRPEADVDEDEVRELEGDLIDLEGALRDAVVPALPFQPVCRDDCPGLCSECGARLADDPEHHHDVVDPRWAALQGLTRAPGQSTDDQEEN